MTQREKAVALQALHRPGNPVVFVNVWDAVSARIIESAGFPAVATTSAGISWLEGFADGERMSRERALQGVSRVARAVTIPVTADLEAGYGPSVEDAIATARGAIEAGAVGLNFEDWDNRSNALLPLDAQAERIAAIRKAGEESGVPLVINARTDVFLRGVGDSDASRFDEAVRRANAYLDAGAGCDFVPMVNGERTIAALCDAIHGPVNVLAGPATPSVERLGQLGVARVSMGASAMAYILTPLRKMAGHVRDTGTFDFTAQRMSHAEINALFPR